MLLWATVFLALVTPVALMVVYYDLRYMRIPNRLVLATAAIFLLTGPFLLAFDDYLIRASLGLFMLVLGFLLHLTGRVPGGDIKYASAILPFVATPQLIDFVFILAIMGILGVIVHRGAKLVGLAPADWVSWQRKGAFPYGLSLAAALIYYLARAAFFTG